jgi:hypothetical protein
MRLGLYVAITLALFLSEHRIADLGLEFWEFWEFLYFLGYISIICEGVTIPIIVVRRGGARRAMAYFLTTCAVGVYPLAFFLPNEFSVVDRGDFEVYALGLATPLFILWWGAVSFLGEMTISTIVSRPAGARWAIGYFLTTCAAGVYLLAYYLPHQFSLVDLEDYLEYVLGLAIPYFILGWGAVSLLGEMTLRCMERYGSRLPGPAQ